MLMFSPLKSSQFRHRLVLANWVHYAATPAFSINSLQCCCKPTAHCNKTRVPVDLCDEACKKGEKEKVKDTKS